jgi:hypothetical protein
MNMKEENKIVIRAFGTYVEKIYFFNFIVWKMGGIFDFLEILLAKKYEKVYNFFRNLNIL